MRIAAATLYAVAISVLTAGALALAQGALSPANSAVALLAGFVAGVTTFWKTRGQDAPQPAPGPWEWAAIVLFALASARAFLWLVFVDGDEIRVLSPNNLGDLALHLTYIEHLASGAPFWPENPIFAHGALTYPLGVDFFNSLLTAVGLDTQRGLLWVGLGGAALIGLALWQWGRGIALLALLGNGGLAGFAILLGSGFQDYQAELAWKHFFLALVVTQRGLLFALPAGLLLLTSWRARFFHPGQPTLPRWGELLLYASLPLFHLHTFIALSLLLGAWFVMVPAARRPLLGLIAGAFVPATALVLLVTDRFRGASVLGWKPGWMWDDAAWLTWCEQHLPGSVAVNAPLLFWPVNFGFLLPLVGWLAVRLWPRRDLAWPRALFFSALGLFLLCVFVKFAPWEWDNTKLMIWAYLASVPVAWQELLAARPLWQRAVAVVLLFGSGLVSLIGGLDARHTGYELAHRSTVDFVAAASSAIPPHERFVGYPTYNHPLLLAGRKMALGYAGHAWSHGLDWTDTAAQVEALLRGDPQWRQLAASLRSRYLFWGALEKEHFADSPQPWTAEALLVDEGEWGAIYDLTQPPAPPAP